MGRYYGKFWIYNSFNLRCIITGYNKLLSWYLLSKESEKISTKYTEGYLGVGITNKFLRPGKVAIVVTDNEGVIVECNILSGMMVLSKFYKYKEYEGEHIDTIDWNKKKHKKVVEEAINKIIFQKVNKRNSVLNKKLVS